MPGSARQHRDPDADQRDRVAVAFEHADAALAQREDRRREQHQPEHHPLRLLARERRFDAVDHHDPDAGQDGHEREQVGVGVRQRVADHEVRSQAQAEEQRAVGQRHAGGVVERQVGRAARSVTSCLDEDRGEAGRHQQRGGHEAEKLAIPGAEHPLEGIHRPGACAPVRPLRLLASASSAAPRARPQA